MDKLRIVPMTLSHLNQVLDIEDEVFPSPWKREVFLQELDAAHVSRPYVGLSGDVVVGYFIAWFVHDEVHLVNIAVTDGWQRQGIGSRLLTYLIYLAVTEEKNIITLEVRPSNPNAISFYEAFSFVQVGVRKEYYSDNREDAILMTLNLADYVRRLEGDR